MRDWKHLLTNLSNASSKSLTLWVEGTTITITRMMLGEEFCLEVRLRDTNNSSSILFGSVDEAALYLSAKEQLLSGSKPRQKDTIAWLLVVEDLLINKQKVQKYYIGDIGTNEKYLEVFTSNTLLNYSNKPYIVVRVTNQSNIHSDSVFSDHNVAAKFLKALYPVI